jgi:hypothetical protein
MLVELCVRNYAPFDGLVNGGNGIFKASITYCEKTIIWIMFQNFEIEILTIYIYVVIIYIYIYIDNIDSKWTPIEPIIKDIRVGKSHSFILTRIQFPIQLATTKTIHHSHGLSLNELVFDLTKV